MRQGAVSSEDALVRHDRFGVLLLDPSGAKAALRGAVSAEEQDVPHGVVGQHDRCEGPHLSADRRVVERRVAAVVERSEPAQNVHVLVTSLVEQHLRKSGGIGAVREVEDAGSPLRGAARRHPGSVAKRKDLTYDPLDPAKVTRCVLADQPKGGIERRDDGIRIPVRGGFFEARVEAGRSLSKNENAGVFPCVGGGEILGAIQAGRERDGLRQHPRPGTAASTEPDLEAATVGADTQAFAGR
jgi:hypothetical protein